MLLSVAVFAGLSGRPDLLGLLSVGLAFTGTVEEVLVDDTRHVIAGQPLLKLERLLIQPNECLNVQDFVRISSLAFLVLLMKRSVAGKGAHLATE